MPDLAVLADDFTGALDTGVQFAKAGISTAVHIWGGKSENIQHALQCDAKVAVIDLESRHDEAKTAYKKVYETSRMAFAAGIKHIYKKTDSALRGNIGAELTALLEASGADCLEFIPAFPKNGRTTAGGVHFISGIPVAESVFGKDPFNPVKHSNVAELIAEQSDTAVSFGKNLSVPHIRVHDAQSDGDVARIAKSLNNLTATAGCAAFAHHLPEILNITPDIKDTAQKAKGKNLLLVSGSVNEITLAQIENAKKSHKVFSLAGSTKDITEEFEKSCVALLSSADENNKPDFSALAASDTEQLRVRTANEIARRTAELFAALRPGTLAVFGGDTLLAVVREIGCTQIIPVSEISSGTVLCRAKTESREFMLVTKSGGFGEADIVEKIKQACVAG